MKSNEQLAEQLLDTTKSERPKEHVLKTSKTPTAEAAKQRKDIQNDLGK
jgi:hypothetical protein